MDLTRHWGPEAQSGSEGSPSRDWAVWRRVAGPGRAALDLMHARLVRHHFAPHLHEEYAIGACTAGLERIAYRGAEHTSGPGSLVVVEPGEVHTGVPADRAGFRYRVLYPPAGLLAELCGTEGLRGPLPHFPRLVYEDPRLAAGLVAVHRVLAEDGADPLEADSRLVELLAALVHRHALPRTARPPAPRLTGAVMARLADQLLSPPALGEIAAELGLSRYQLLRGFRAEVGLPPYAWLAQYRVARARRLLAAGGRPAEVAAQVGFADQAHLTRWFRRVVGVTPAAFRNSVQDGPGRRLAE